MKIIAELKPSVTIGYYDIYIGSMLIISYDFGSNLPKEFKPEESITETSISKILELKKTGFNPSEIIDLKENKMI